MVDENFNPWQTINEEKIYDNPWISLHHKNVITPGGEKGIYGVVKYKHTAIGIVPLDKDLNTYIVGQYRLPLEKYSWEIPEGGGEPNEDPLVSAQRELSEECGIVAKKWKLIQNFHLSNSVTDEVGYLFIAQDLIISEAHPDSNEELETKKIPFSELFEMVLNGTVTDSMTIMAVFKTKYLIDNQLI